MMTMKSVSTQFLRMNTTSEAASLSTPTYGLRTGTDAGHRSEAVGMNQMHSIRTATGPSIR